MGSSGTYARDREKDGLTAYGRLANELWARIRSGEWQAGDKLPIVADLAKEYGVAPVTVRTALKVLSAQGLVHARQGSGTYVTPEASAPNGDVADEGPLDADYFHSWIIGPSEVVRVLEKETGTRCPATLADGAPVHPDYVRLKRLHLRDETPVCIVDFYMTNEAYESLPQGIDGQFKVGLLLMTRARPRPVRGRQIVTVETAIQSDAAILQIAPAASIVRVTRRFLDAEGRVLGGGVHRYPGTVFRQVIDEPIEKIFAGLGHWLPSETT